MEGKAMGSHAADTEDLKIDAYAEHIVKRDRIKALELEVSALKASLRGDVEMLGIKSLLFPGTSKALATLAPVKASYVEEVSVDLLKVKYPNIDLASVTITRMTKKASTRFTIN
jgi:hypothetical protein